MTRKFKMWSETDPGAQTRIQADLELRGWKNVSVPERKSIVDYLCKEYFCDRPETFHSIRALNHRYLRERYGRQVAEHDWPHLSVYESDFDLVDSCCIEASLTDFREIFCYASADVVFELLSYFAKLLIGMNSGVEDQEKYQQFDEFANLLNHVFTQYGINYSLARQGFVPRQDGLIVTQVYEPVLKILSEPKWSEVSRELSDAFADYCKGTPENYSTSLTHAVSGVQAFLQVLVHEKTGKGDIKDLIREAKGKNLIPADRFSSEVLDLIHSHLMKERQLHGDPHPKNQYATEEHVLLVLNLAMVFIQHCLRDRPAVKKVLESGSD